MVFSNQLYGFGHDDRLNAIAAIMFHSIERLIGRLIKVDLYQQKDLWGNPERGTCKA